jgi:glutamate carboxypeptidase
MSDIAALVGHFASGITGHIEVLRELVEHESHTEDKEGVDRLASWLADEFGRLGADIELLPHAKQGNAVRGRWAGADPPVLILGHLDTVWPAGTLARLPFRVDGDVARGPGIFDMKAGILLTLILGQAIAAGRWRPGNSVEFLFTSDEEAGTEAGLPHLRAVAKRSRAVLCLEPPLPGGRVKTSRKAVAVYQLEVAGIAAHAGLNHELGANAIVELSRQLVRASGMTDYAKGRTVSPGRVWGGTASNVVPDRALAEIDVRFAATDDGLEFDREIRSWTAVDPRCTLKISGGVNRPPLERTLGVVRLFGIAREVAREAGFELGEGSSGGGSDGSFTAAMGIPTLDGLGVEGDGAHATHENIRVADIPRRAALLAGLIERL